MNKGKNNTQISIAGAGISGLTAAIILAKNGYEVTVYEVNSYPGGRFKGDWQHLENWTDEEDILDYLKNLGLEINFFTKPCYKLSIHAPSLRKVDLRSSVPLFYSVRRGSPEESIDYGLFKQAKDLGVKVIFNAPIRNKEVDIIATGPQEPFVYTAGLNFSSNEEEKIFILVDKNLSLVYAYLSIIDGKGTLASSHKNPLKAKENLDRFRKRINKFLEIKVESGQFFQAEAAFSLRKPLVRNNTLYVGEAAGFQDKFTIFGITTAIKSGHLAAESLMKNSDYEAMCQKEILPLMQASYVNFSLTKLVPNQLLNYLVPAVAGVRSDFKEVLKRASRKSLPHSLLFPLLWQGEKAVRKIIK